LEARLPRVLLVTMAAGNLRHQVQLQAPVIVQDPDTGEMETTWETIAEPWAEVIPMSAREFVAAAAEQSEVRGRIVIRYRPDVDATMRVVHRGRWYQIHGVLEDKVSGIEYLTLMTGEGVRLDQ
jgi:SPP1 family predicted phage head-tail adaptor